jgi:hypothetical protein
MKKKLCYLILLSLMIIIPINAKALTGSVSITCDKESYGMNDTATCSVKGTSNEEVYSISASIVDTSNATIEFITDSAWQGNGDEGNIQLYTDTGKKGTFNIGTLKVKLKDTSTSDTSLGLEIKDVKFGDTDGTEEDITASKATISFSQNTNNDNQGSITNDNSNTSDTTNSNSSKTSVKNPKTADVKIALVIFGILVAGVFITIGYKEVKKKG